LLITQIKPLSASPGTAAITQTSERQAATETETETEGKGSLATQAMASRDGMAARPDTLQQRSRNSSSRNLPIDTLRGLACLLLVSFHIVGANASLGLGLPVGHPLHQFNDALSHLRMPLFCFLSGFVYAWRPYNGEMENFFRGKVRRLLVPMLIVGTLFALIQSAAPGTNLRYPDWRLLHVVPVAHYWFLESLFVIFMVTAGLENLGLLKTVGRFGVVMMFATLLFMDNPMPHELFGLEGAVYLMPFFLVGLACHRFRDRFPARSELLLGLLLPGICAYYAVAQAMPRLAEMPSLLLGAGACVLIQRCRFESRWLAAIGQFSFGIYLFHAMFTAASRIVLTRLGIESTALLFASGMILGILGPILVVHALRVSKLGAWVLGESTASRPSKLTAGQAMRPTTP
jgi:surface polysaccharide O-acyltransferase-like enzyme